MNNMSSTWLLLFTLLTSIGQATEPQKGVSIFPFKVLGKRNKCIGEFIAGMYERQARKCGQHQIRVRTGLREMIAARIFQQNKIVASDQTLLRKLGVGFVILGTVTDMGGQFQGCFNLYTVKNGRAVACEKIRGANFEGFIKVLLERTQHLLKQKPWERTSKTCPALINQWGEEKQITFEQVLVHQHDDIATAVKLNPQGGYVLTGYTTMGSGHHKAWLIKTDARGKLVWRRSFGGQRENIAQNLAVTSDNGFIIAGWTNSFGAGDADAWLIRTDAQGQVLWEEIFGGEDKEQAEDVQPTSDGGFIVAGWTESFGAGDADVWLVRTDKYGNRLWQKTFGSEDYEMARRVCPTADGGFVILGKIFSFDKGETRIWLIKTDSQGRKIWERTYGGRDYEEVHALAQVADGFLLSGTGALGAGVIDAWVIKTDLQGRQLWSHRYGGPKWDEVHDLHPTGDGGLILVGWTKSFGAGDSDIWLLKLNAKGERMWDRTFGGADGDRAFAVAQTPDQGFLIAGATRSFGKHDSDIWLLKTDTQGRITVNPIVVPTADPPSDKAAITFACTLGGAQDDSAYYVTNTRDGGYVVAGVTCSKGHGSSDAWLVKLDARGQRLWEQTYGGPGEDQACWVCERPDGRLVVVGQTSSQGAGSSDAWIFTTDAQGRKLGEIVWGEAGREQVLGAASLSQGGYLVVGATNSLGSGREDIWLVRIDRLGEIVYQKTFGGVSGEWGRCVVPTSDGGCVIAGETWSFGAGWSDGWLLKIDPQGKSIWARTYGQKKKDRLWSVVELPAQGYLAVGTSNCGGHGQEDAWVVRTDLLGRPLWERKFGSAYKEMAYSIIPTRAGAFMICGCKFSFGDDDCDVWLVKIDAAGRQLWNRTYGGRDYDRAYACQQTADGGFIIVGDTWSGIGGQKDAWVLKIDKDGNLHHE